MTVALDPKLPFDLLSNLIVADIAPSIGALSPEFQGYIQAMKKIEDSEVKSRQEADRLLKPFEQVHPSVRGFRMQLADVAHRIP